MASAERISSCREKDASLWLAPSGRWRMVATTEEHAASFLTRWSLLLLVNTVLGREFSDTMILNVRRKSPRFSDAMIFTWRRLSCLIELQGHWIEALYALTELESYVHWHFVDPLMHACFCKMDFDAVHALGSQTKWTLNVRYIGEKKFARILSNNLLHGLVPFIVLDIIIAQLFISRLVSTVQGEFVTSAGIIYASPAWHKSTKCCRHLRISKGAKISKGWSVGVEVHRAKKKKESGNLSYGHHFSFLWSGCSTSSFERESRGQYVRCTDNWIH